MIERKLTIFCMAAELKHFTEAATALNMTQPNVTRQIAQLERELGTALFERDGRQVKLTAAGKVLLEESNLLIAAAENIAGKVRCAAAGIKRYRIGATMTAGGYVLPSLLTAFMHEYPDCNLSIHIANTAEIADMLEKHLLDLALIEGPFDSNCFFSSLLLRDELKFVGAPGSLSGREFCLADYLKSGERFILRESGSGTRHHFDEYLQQHNLPLPPESTVVEANSFDTIKHMARSGFGITCISELAVRDELDAGTLESTVAVEGPLSRDMNFIYLPTGKLKFAERFINFCRRKVIPE
ncbi:MAG: LysR family transcriptional regulator [Victivallaceae bacterium]